MSDYEGVETVETVRIAGRVKWFDPGKGYGFIVPDEPNLTDMKDVLLHISLCGLSDGGGTEWRSADFSAFFQSYSGDLAL